MIEYNEAEKVLETYEFLEILELNEVTETDVLCFLVEQEFLKLPSIKPL